MDVSWCPATDSDGLVELYNCEISNVPYSHPVSVTQFRAAIGRSYMGAPDEELCVVRNDDKVAAFAHITEETTGNHLYERVGIIRFLLYRRGLPAIGQGLLAEVEERLRLRGVQKARAFADFNYCFYNHCTYRLTDGWDHVLALFGASGYQVQPFNVMMDMEHRELRNPSQRSSGIEVRISHEDCTAEQMPHLPGGIDQPVIRVEAIEQGEVIGVTLIMNLFHYTGLNNHKNICEIGALGVKKSERRQGIATHIVLAGLREAASCGLHQAIVETGQQNFGAQLFYQCLGFRRVSCNYTLSKSL